MFDRTEPYWRYLYELPTPLLKNPTQGGRVNRDDPDGDELRKLIVPTQTRSVTHDPVPQRERWDLVR